MSVTPDPTCVSPDQLEEIVRLGAEHPLSRHLGDCPRCRALVRSFKEFLDPTDIPRAAKLAEADQRLAQALEQATGVHTGVPRPESSQRSSWRRSPWKDPLTRFLSPSYRPLLVGGSLALVLAVLLLGRGDQTAPENPVLRGLAQEQFHWITGPAEVASDGSISVSWPAHPQAERYRVLFLDAGLGELLRREAGRETSLDLAAEDCLPSGERPLLWQVVALRDGDELAHSAPQPIPAP